MSIEIIDNEREFEKFERKWRAETFLSGAFGLDQDIEVFLDDPECGVGNPAFDMYADEFNDYLWGI